MYRSILGFIALSGSLAPFAQADDCQCPSGKVMVEYQPIRVICSGVTSDTTSIRYAIK